MLLYLVRHAIAADRTADQPNDFDRPLTAEGVKKMRHHAEVLRRLGVTMGQIWTSPLVRARQTAELLAAGLDCGARVEIVEALAPSPAPHGVLGELVRRAPQGDVGLVGHQPDMGELAGHLLSARRTDHIEFKKGGVACFEIDELREPVSGRLQWLLTPKVMGSVDI